MPRDMSAEAAESVVIETEDGRRLAGRWRLPRGRARGVLVIHGATGVPQRFYRAFAAWAAESRGLAVLTYDYRDFGESLSGDIRRSDATFLDWGLKDQSAAIDHAAARAPNGRVRVIGHSLGGLFLNRARRADRIDHAVAIAAGDATLFDSAPITWPLATAFWFGPAPLLTMTFGYLPGAASGFGADLPAGVFWEWRRMCLEPGYGERRAPPAPELGADAFPIDLMGAADDPLIQPSGVWRLERRYAAHPIRRRLLKPADFGLGGIGHLGAFSRAGAPLWPVLADAA